MNFFSRCLLTRNLNRFIKNFQDRQIVSMCEKIKIGVIQLQSTTNKLENFEICKHFIEEASKNGAQMAFLPENFDFLSESKEQAFELSEFLDGNLISNYKKLAMEKNIFLSLGGFHRKISKENNHKIFNTHVVIDNNGVIKETYDKLHLFDVDIPNMDSIRESNVVQAGTCVKKPVKTPLGLMGMSICYDVRFPEMSQSLRESSADVLTFPSAFTVKTGQAHWHVLLRARAIDNQCFVVAAAQQGRHNTKRTSYGHSLVVDPWGTIIAERTEAGPGLLMCDIDLSIIGKIRSNLPVFQHRRLDLFPQLSSQVKPINIRKEAFQFGPHVVAASCVFLQSTDAFAFVNISPLVPGHVLVSPIRAVQRFADLTLTELTHIYFLVHIVGPGLSAHFGASAMTISQQDGVDAGQSVPHVHVHILPRKPGDFASNDDIYQSLQNHDKPGNLARKYRSVEDMSKEASEFRNLFNDHLL